VPQGRAEAGGLRSLRPCRLREWRRTRAGGFGAATASPPRCPISSRIIFGDFMGGRRAGRGRARRARLGPALQSRDQRSRRPSTASTVEIDVPTWSPARPARDPAPSRAPSMSTCATCNGHGKVRAAAGLLHHRAHLPDLPRPRPDDRAALPDCGAPGPRQREPHALGQHSARASRTAPASGSPARARPGCAAAAGRSLHLHLHQAARPLPARRRRPVLPRADLHDHGRARRRIRGADPRGDGGEGQGGPRAPSRASSCASRARACRCCARGHSAISTCSSMSRRRRTSPANSASLLDGVREGILQQDPPGIVRLLFQDEGFLRPVRADCPPDFRQSVTRLS
jgi:hypothetical protein